MHRCDESGVQVEGKKKKHPKWGQKKSNDHLARTDAKSKISKMLNKKCRTAQSSKNVLALPSCHKFAVALPSLQRNALTILSCQQHAMLSNEKQSKANQKCQTHVFAVPSC